MKISGIGHLDDFQAFQIHVFHPFFVGTFIGRSPSVSAVWALVDRFPIRVLLAGHGFSCLDALGALVGRQLCTLAMRRVLQVDLGRNRFNTKNQSSIIHQ